MFGLSPALLWAIAGIALIVVELVSTTFVLVFFGVGALITAIAAAAGVESFMVQVIIFSVVSAASLVLLRKLAKGLFSGHADMPPDHLGQRVPVVDEIPPGGEGRVRYRGSPWIAYSDAADTIPAGTMVEVVDASGIRLKVKRFS